MDRPPADPRKLQATWDGWVAGESTPGRVVADCKTGGLADILAHRAEAEAEADGATALLASWSAWERGELPPGPLLAALAEGGLPTVLAELVAATAAEPA